MSSDYSAFQPTERVTQPDLALPAGPGNSGPLDAGACLGEFEIQRVLGVGGFGIVYQAMDRTLDRQVAIKEYMPTALATRAPDGTVAPIAASVATTFTMGRDSFVNEAKLLARFDHPALVKVHRFWEERGTAYMVMPFYEGKTLAQTRPAAPGVPTQAWLDALLVPLLGAMETLHEQRVFHRDIAPDNILILDDGHPVLLDLGAARRVISDRTQSLTTILKPRFAPIEQYGQSAELTQGPWTDLYALAAVLYFCISGSPPQEAATRAVQDGYAKLSDPKARLALPGLEKLDRRLLLTIDWALSVHPRHRPQSVHEFREALSNGPPRTEPRIAPASPHTDPAKKDSIKEAARNAARNAPRQGALNKETPRNGTGSLRRYWPVAALALIAAGVIGGMQGHRTADVAVSKTSAASTAGQNTPKVAPPSSSAKTTSLALAATVPSPPVVGASTAAGSGDLDVSHAKQVSSKPSKHSKASTAHPVVSSAVITPIRNPRDQSKTDKNAGSDLSVSTNNGATAHPGTSSAPGAESSSQSTENSAPATLWALRQMCINQGATRVLACMDRYCAQDQNAASKLCRRLRQREFNAGF